MEKSIPFSHMSDLLYEEKLALMVVNTGTELDTDLAPEDYLVVGVSACYQQDDGELIAVQVLEPIPSAYLESIFQGVPTSYQRVLGTTVETVFSDHSAAQISGVEGAVFCHNFGDRAAAAVRTYKSRPESSTLVEIGSIRTDINHSMEKKRVLNAKNVVTKDDNVRQHQYTHQTL